MANRLANESSPYLLQHKDNPVDWHPWGETALSLAQSEDKPIFLSIGYAACHWCHVMAHESFEDEETAKMMNEHFINVKVDREERPDIDSIYMDSVVALTGQGGWPLSVFLTPDGKPFYGGTYFPPTRRHQMPSFREVLTAIARSWEEDRDQVLANGEQLTQRLRETPSLTGEPESVDPAVLKRAVERLFRSYDWTHGGFGRAPKFPQPTSLTFLFKRHLRSSDNLALRMGTHKLERMASGGIYDHLGGGFARYSVDNKWLVPHFEKMLYDNALLLGSYLEGWLLTDDPQFLRVIQETYDFLNRELQHPEGGYFSSLDADSEGEEGKFYLWEWSEIQELLRGDSAELFTAAYGVTESGNFEGRNILYRDLDDYALAERFQIPENEVRIILSQAKDTLFQARQERVRPGLDDKVLTSWNGLMLRSLANVARSTDDQDILTTAQDLAGFLLAHLVQEGQLKRSWREGQARFNAYLEDHAALGLGMLALYQADFNSAWLEAALDQAEKLLSEFVDPKGGFFDVRDEDHPSLIARPKSLQDSPIPSGNTMACDLLLQLAALTGEERYRLPAETAVVAMQETAAQHPTTFAGWLGLVDWLVGPQLQLAIAGSPDSQDFQALFRVVRERYIPNLVIAGGDAHHHKGPALLEGRSSGEEGAIAYLCQNFTCNLPTSSPQELVEQIQDSLPS